MTQSTPNVIVPDELNLKRYIDVVLHLWYLILLCGILGAAGAYLVGALQPKMYSAHTDIAILRTGTIVTFDPKIRTISDTDPGAQSADSVSRRRSLTALSTSPDLQNRVIALMGTQLPETLRDPVHLQAAISFTIDGDLLTATATTSDPKVSALLANTWGTEYSARVNKLFGSNPDSEELISAQAAQAKQDYDTKQAAVNDFLQSTSIEQLKRQQALLSTELDAQVLLQNKLSQLSEDVKALRDRVAASGSTPSDADRLTQILIQANAFANGGDTSPAFRLDIASSTSATLTTQQELQQLDELAKAIEARRSAVSDTQVQQWYTQLNTVQSQLEQTQQQLKEIQAARDLAWTTYQTLTSKVAEVHVSNGSENELVRLVSSATVPPSPNAVRATFNVLIGALLGLVIGFVVALILDFRRARTRVLNPALQ